MVAISDPNKPWKVAQAHLDDLQLKLPIFKAAIKEFVDSKAKFKSSTEELAQAQAVGTEEPMSIFKQHLHMFEKVLNLVKTFYSLHDWEVLCQDC